MCRRGKQKMCPAMNAMYDNIHDSVKNTEMYRNQKNFSKVSKYPLHSPQIRDFVKAAAFAHSV